MNEVNYSIKTMSREEINIAVDWAADEEWNPGLHDADSFYAADPTGFLIGKLNDEPVATISVVRYGKSFGFLGFYIVKPEYRGKGYGIKIWNAGMEYLKGRNVGLDGVVDQQENYKKSGFKLAYRNIRFESTVNDRHSNENKDIIGLSETPVEYLNTYDGMFFPEERSMFLKSWINMPESKGIAVINGNKIIGYGLARKCRKGYKIGPLFADSYNIAESLFTNLTSEVPSSESFYLDVPEENENALKLVDKYKMNKVFETARMYTGEFPGIPLNKLFGVTTFELG